MQNNDQNVGRYLVYADVLAVYSTAQDIKWGAVQINSVHRILYLCTVLYSFRFPDITNPFSNYHFTVNIGGPYDPEINDGIVFLLKDDYIERTHGEDMLILGKNRGSNIFDTDSVQERFQWIKDVMFILAVYGEDKVYDFIFRDPEYQTTIKSNTQRGLDTDLNNDTVKTLVDFQSIFEENVPDAKTTLSIQRYLELYFEYVFSKILKRQD